MALNDGAIETAMAMLDDLPPDSTVSMQRDIMEARPSEFEFQNSAVVRIGKDVGVGTPVNSLIYHSLLPQELEARGQSPT